MKILIVSRAIPHHGLGGGMERSCWDIARTLSSRADVTVLTTAVPGLESEFTSDGVLVIALKCRPGRYSLLWWMKSGSYSGMSRYDVVLGVSGGATSIFWTRFGFSKVIQAHGTSWSEAIGALSLGGVRNRLRALRMLYWVGIDFTTFFLVDRVIPIAEKVKAELEGLPYGPALRNKISEPVRNGVDVSAFVDARSARWEKRAELGAGVGEKVVASVGRLTHQKGVDRLIRALAEDSPRSIILLVVGDGPERKNLEHLSVELRVEDRVRFLGVKPASEIPSLLAASDLFVFPVRAPGREGAPIAVLEALASGLDVLVARGATWPCDLVHLVVEFDAEDSAALAGAMHGAGNGVRQRCTLPASYDLAATSEKYADILRSTI